MPARVHVVQRYRDADRDGCGTLRSANGRRDTSADHDATDFGTIFGQHGHIARLHPVDRTQQRKAAATNTVTRPRSGPRQRGAAFGGRRHGQRHHNRRSRDGFRGCSTDGQIATRGQQNRIGDLRRGGLGCLGKVDALPQVLDRVILDIEIGKVAAIIAQEAIHLPRQRVTTDKLHGLVLKQDCGRIV